MTTETRMLKAVATLKSALAAVRRLAAGHPDPSARRVFQGEERRLGSMLGRLEGRLQEVRRQEPEYGGQATPGREPDPVARASRGREPEPAAPSSRGGESRRGERARP